MHLWDSGNIWRQGFGISDGKRGKFGGLEHSETETKWRAKGLAIICLL